MRSMKKKSMEQLTSALMALMMAVTTTISPVTTLANEIESSTAIESQTTAEATVAEEPSSVVVQAETDVSVGTESTTPEVSSNTDNESTLDAQTSEAPATITETTVTTYEEETTLSTPTESSEEENTESSSTNETRAPDDTTAGMGNESIPQENTSTEMPTITLSAETTKDEILSYIEAIGGNESDAFYAFIGGLGAEDYWLVWMAQYGAEEDQLASKFGFDYDAASDLEAGKYLQSLSTDEQSEFVESMTFEQYRRYLSIIDMLTEMGAKDFSNAIDTVDFTVDRTWDYASYDAFAEAMTGVSLQRTDQTMQFYNTYVDPSKVEAGVTTIDSLLDSNADWYSNDYILSLNPELFKETVPVYYGSDGSYYVISTIPSLNGVESADYQPATSFYNGSVEAQAFTDIEYLGNGVYRIPRNRYQYCFTEQYVSDMGTLYGISFGLRIQVLYGFTPFDDITIAADVLYPDMTEKFLPATLNLLSGTATVKVFNDDFDDTVDNYLISASINRGASLPESVGTLDNGKTLQFSVNDALAVGSFDVLIGYNAVSKYSMAAEITTPEMYATQDSDISLTAELYNGTYLKVASSSVPSDLKVGDKFVYENTRLTIVGVNTTYDGKGDAHIGATTVTTHDAQSFCFYNRGGDTAFSEVSTWFKEKLNNTDSEGEDPGYMVIMTEENIAARAANNGSSVNLGMNKIFGYVTDGLNSTSNDDKKTLNLEGTQVLLSCMHAWGNESTTTPQDVVNSIKSFTGRGDFAEDEGYGHYHPNIALQCTKIEDTTDGYTNATFKVTTSLLKVGGIANPQNYQCAFATLRITYQNPKTGYLRVHKSSDNTTMTDNNSCYTFKGIQYGVYSEKACKTKVATLTLGDDGYSTSTELDVGTYYVKETSVGTSTGYKLSDTVYTVEVKAEHTSNSPLTCETTDSPLNDPFGIVINKINSDGSTTADMSGAEYTIKYYAGDYTSVDKLPAKATQTWVIKTIKNANGNYHAYLDDAHIVSGSAGAVFGKDKATGMYVIPLGTITVQETKAPAGFTTDGATVNSAKNGTAISGTNGVYLFRIVNENSGIYLKNGNALSTEVSDETAMSITYSEVQNKCGISIQKSDFMTSSSTPSGNADLSGIKFAIVNSTGASITYDKRVIANGEVVKIITTDAKGYAATGASELPIGKYTVKELRKDASLSGSTLSEGTSSLANDSYMWQDNKKEVTLKDSDANKIVSAGTVYNTPVTATPKFEKHDLELNKKASMAGTDFKGIVLEIYNNSKNAVTIDGQSYAKDAVIASITADESGSFTFNTKLPIGDYYVKEKKANDYYLTSTQTRKFSVVLSNGNGAISYEDGATSVVFSDRVIRGDIVLTKKNSDDNSALAYVPFKITNNATGETHYILTGTNGKFDSSIGKTTHTNANDTVLSKYDPKDTIPQSVIDTLTKDAGVWFGLGNDNDKTMTSANASYGSLVYGTYTITEMKTEATKSMTMLSATVTIGTDAQKVDLGDMMNIPVKISTTLTDDADNDHYAQADSTINLTDTIQYQNLPTGKSYTITATLYIKDGSNLTKYDEKTVTFKPTSRDGSTKVLFGNVSTKGLAGKSLVCYEELTCDGEFIAEHKNPNDEGQTIHFPTVSTTAIAASTNDHIAQATQNLKITDTVTMTSLCPGDTYKITATLMNKATNTAVKVKGVDVVVTKTFVADSATMQVEVDFSIDASALAGTTTVAFETLSYGSTVIARHEDINDSNQTVYLPSVKTTAKDAESKTNYAAPKENAEIIDTVSYTNLIPGKSYQVTGKLMSKTTGQVVTVNGKEITVTKTFTASDSGSGTVEMSFKFNATGLTGQYVVFETIYYNNVAVAVHEDIDDTDQTILFSKLTVLKLSQDDDYVVGAKLEIRDSNGKVVEAFETKKNGDVFYRLAFDTEYTLVETEAPDGYFVADPIKFQLKENGKVLVDGQEKDELVMVDEYSTGYLEITKQSIVSHKLLPGAVYGVYSDEACTTLVATLETDENGSATSDELEHGTYWVREIKAPKGYRFDYTIYGPYEIEGRHETVSDTFYDMPIPPVPTGIIMTFWPYLVALGVGIVVFVGLALLKKHNKKKE